MIKSIWFYDLLDCLAGQFFSTGKAYCVGNDFGIHFSVAAKEYFTIAIIQEKLHNNKEVLGVLIDDSAHIAASNGYTFVIYIDTRRISKHETYKILASLILAHEICHFAYYYELFIKLGDNTGIVTHSNFTHTVSGKLIGAITKEQNSTSQTILDEHDIESFLSNFKKFPKKHFSKGRETKINFKSLLDDFCANLNIGGMIEEYMVNKRARSR